MIRALNTGVMGMRQFQTSLDVIGNNLANINTVAYKGARVEFADTLSQTMRAPTPDTATTSGSVGMQIGNGMQVSAIKNTFTQGAMKNTGVRTDLAINGKGFFLVKDSTTNQLFATRAGDFREDKNGFLVTNDGFRVQGRNKLSPAFTESQKLEIGDLKLDAGQYTADRTGVSLDYISNELTKTAHGFVTGNQVKFSSILPAIANDTNTTETVFFTNKVSDDKFTLHRTAADAATGSNKVNFTNDSSSPFTGFTTDVANDKISGSFVSDWFNTGDSVYVKEGTIPGGLTPGTHYYVSRTGDDLQFHTTSADAIAGTNTIDLTTSGSSDFKVIRDYGTLGSITVVGGASISQYSFGADGGIKMLLTDGTQYDRGQVLLQTFKNEQTLVKVGANRFDNLSAAGAYGVDSNSASATELLSNAQAPGEGGTGRIQAGALELSNVDMADEFSRMITVQRAFQANARVISTSDEILKEMMALKR
ncbi:MAG: flagellar hook-basal body complex protein [Verrucomicrobiota bacterium]|nr:flagellar hook-basal body complex protein [Verrucomicrobiota bacterium]MEE2813375.1 flagellar hook-basal body complex protein [Verrucomicrobiota bacterium]